VGDALAEPAATDTTLDATRPADADADALREAAADDDEAGANRSVLDANEQPTTVKTTKLEAMNEARQRIAGTS